LFDHPCLIRVCSGGFENWFSDKPDSSLPAVFRQSDTEHSTYDVGSDVDEALAVAAHQLTKPAQKLDTQCALRIRLPDLEAIGMPISRRHLGETGVIRVDHWHCDLLGDKNAMGRLISRIRERSLKGEDRVRRFNRYQLQLIIERILDLGVEERPNHTAELCELILNRRSQLSRDRAQAIRELALARIPDSAIRAVAFALYEERRSSAGSSIDDWFTALAQLRKDYATHYLATHFVRG
jgi:hypothetical protein